MTSQKFSANKQAAKYDLKASFKSNAGCALFLAVCSAVIFIISPLGNIFNYIGVDESNKAAGLRELRYAYEMLLTDINSVYIGFALLFCGALFALKAFDFSMKKRLVNVYYSSPVDRRTMFKNRVISSICLIAGVLFVLITADAFINIKYFEHSAYIFRHSALLWGEAMIYCLTGFSIALLAASAAPTIIESIFFTGAIAVIPSVIYFAFDTLASVFLRGYQGAFDGTVGDGVHKGSIFVSTANFNPLFLGKRFGGTFGAENFFEFACRNATEDKKLQYQNAGFDYVIPIIIWAAVCVVLISAARYLFIKRKAENSGIHGSVSAVTAIFSAALSVAVVAFTLNIIRTSSLAKTFLLMLGALAVLMLIYFISISVNRRTVKHKAKAFAVPAAAYAVILLCCVVMGTGAFGWSAYSPRVDDIKCAYITNGYADASGGQIFTDSIASDELIPYYYPNDRVIGAFTDKEDLEKFVKTAKAVSEKSDDMLYEQTAVCYKLKSGKTVYRYFDTVDREAFFNVLSLTDTKAYREELEYLMLSGESKKSRIAKNSGAIENDDFFRQGIEEDVKASYLNGSVFLNSADSSQTDKEIKNTEALRQALYKDICNSTYEQRFKPEVQALGAVVFGPSEDQDSLYDYEYIKYPQYYTDSSMITIMIYPYMTNTIDYLKSAGEYSFLEAKEKAVSLKATVIKMSEIDVYKEFAKVFYYNIFDKDFLSLTEEETAYSHVDDLNENLETLLEKGKEITDKNQIAQLLNKKHIFRFASDNDAAVVFEYKDSYRSYIIPEKDIPSFVK